MNISEQLEEYVENVRNFRYFLKTEKRKAGDKAKNMHYLKLTIRLLLRAEQAARKVRSELPKEEDPRNKTKMSLLIEEM